MDILHTGIFLGVHIVATATVYYYNLSGICYTVRNKNREMGNIIVEEYFTSVIFLQTQLEMIFVTY